MDSVQALRLVMVSVIYKMGIKSFSHIPGEASDDIGMLLSCGRDDLVLQVGSYPVVPSGSLTSSDVPDDIDGVPPFSFPAVCFFWPWSFPFYGILVCRGTAGQSWLVVACQSPSIGHRQIHT